MLRLRETKRTGISEIPQTIGAILRAREKEITRIFNRPARAGLAAFTLSVKQRLFAVFFHEYRMQIAFGLTS